MLLQLVARQGHQPVKQANWTCVITNDHQEQLPLRQVSSTVAPSGHEWPWVKKAMRNFLRSFHLPPEKRAQHEVDELIKLASAPLQGECYLGIVALGFFVFHFMDPAERQNLIRRDSDGRLPVTLQTCRS
ncbi:GAUT8 [Symbiodinium sp. CCMP2592]|nr:GAUT8 [Symbiodinium sp. CCMP2592]